MVADCLSRCHNEEVLLRIDAEEELRRREKGKMWAGKAHMKNKELCVCACMCNITLGVCV